VISMALFQTIAEWRSQGVAKREIARRLKVDIKTVRRAIEALEAGEVSPQRRSPGSKLDAYAERIVELAAAGCTAWTIYAALREDGAFSGSYELVKKRVAGLRKREPRVFERLTHSPGDEMQVDFGELCRVEHQGQTVRTWALVVVWPYSRYRYFEVVLDQSVPTFLAAIQNSIFASGAVPNRITVDNLAAAILREHFHERGYQREFAAFCKHFDTLPNAVRPRTPTDKGSVENSVGILKRALRGREMRTLEELERAVTVVTVSLNERAGSLDHRRPNDLIVDERKKPLPERFTVANWSEHRVRTDSHIQVRSNFYSVPHTLVGKRVVVRSDARSIAVYDDFAVIARHARHLGRGRTVTDRQHYPEYKRKATQDIRQERVERIRTAGGGAAAFFAGLCRSRDFVHSDQYRALIKLLESTPAADFDRACARAAHYSNYSLEALRRILAERLYELPIDEHSLDDAPAPARIEAITRLEAYSRLLGGWPC